MWSHRLLLRMGRDWNSVGLWYLTEINKITCSSPVCQWRNLLSFCKSFQDPCWCLMDLRVYLLGFCVYMLERRVHRGGLYMLGWRLCLLERKIGLTLRLLRWCLCLLNMRVRLGLLLGWIRRLLIWPLSSKNWGYS